MGTLENDTIVSIVCLILRHTDHFETPAWRSAIVFDQGLPKPANRMRPNVRRLCSGNVERVDDLAVKQAEAAGALSGIIRQRNAANQRQRMRAPAGGRSGCPGG